MNNLRLQWPLSLRATGMLLGGLGTFSLFWFWLWDTDSQVFREHGPMENFQVGTLLVAAGFMVAGARRTKVSAERLLLAAGALLFLTMFVLEFDVRPFGSPLATKIFKGLVRNLFLVVCWGGLAALLLRSRRQVWTTGLSWLLQAPGALTVLSAAFWCAGGTVDKTKPFASPEGNFFAEELLECNGAALMLLCAIILWRRLRQINVPGTP